jgi:hypothetical protein
VHAQRAAVSQDSDEREGLVVVEPDSDRDEIGKDVEMAVDPEPQGPDEADIGRGVLLKSDLCDYHVRMPVPVR